MAGVAIVGGLATLSTYNRQVAELLEAANRPQGASFRVFVTNPTFNRGYDIQTIVINQGTAAGILVEQLATLLVDGQSHDVRFIVQGDEDTIFMPGETATVAIADSREVAQSLEDGDYQCELRFFMRDAEASNEARQESLTFPCRVGSVSEFPNGWLSQIPQ